MQVWALHPAGARDEAKPGSLQIAVRSKDARIWSAMHVDAARAQAAIAGEGLKSERRVGGKTITCDGTSAPMTCR